MLYKFLGIRDCVPFWSECKRSLPSPQDIKKPRIMSRTLLVPYSYASLSNYNYTQVYFNIFSNKCKAPSQHIYFSFIFVFFHFVFLLIDYFISSMFFSILLSFLKKFLYISIDSAFHIGPTLAYLQLFFSAIITAQIS